MGAPESVAYTMVGAESRGAASPAHRFLHLLQLVNDCLSLALVEQDHAGIATIKTQTYFVGQIVCGPDRVRFVFKMKKRSVGHALIVAACAGTGVALKNIGGKSA